MSNISINVIYLAAEEQINLMSDQKLVGLGIHDKAWFYSTLSGSL